MNRDHRRRDRLHHASPRRAAGLIALAGVALLGLPLQMPGQAPREWTPEIFDYARPARLRITDRGTPAEGLPGTRQQELLFRNLRDEEVPLLITFPEKGKGPFPGVLLVHPLGGNRRQMTREMGLALVAQGFACVALDLPMHGERSGKNKPEALFPDHPDRAYRNVVPAVVDIRQTLDAMSEHKELDLSKGVPIVGYSLGAWFGSLAGAADRRVSMLVLQGAGAGGEGKSGAGASGGSKDLLSVLIGERSMLAKYPTLRPEIAIAGFASRPLLMQNGKKDPYISEEHARNLYRAARAPKELKWYESGHILPEKAAGDAAEWLIKNRK